MSENPTTPSVRVTDAQIGQWARTFRKRAGLSQQQVADLLGCPRSAVSLIESGERKLTAAEAFALLFTELAPLDVVAATRERTFA